MSADLDLAYLSAIEMARRVREGDVSPVELVDNALARIDDVNQSLNCFCFVWHDDARAAAIAAAQAVSDRRPLGPLHGVPIALKDTTPTKGHVTTLGSWTQGDHVPARDAHIVESLSAAGAIIVGKTTTPEFAHTLITDSPRFGTTRNPWMHGRTPGGSSGGSAAAVASGCVPLAEGTDMGGSVRIPAAWCGVVGMKPSLGRIPMDVLPGNFDSLSHHGPLARCIDDARIFVSVTQGEHHSDIMSVPRLASLDSPLGRDVRGLRIALNTDLDCWAVHPDVIAAVHNAGHALAAAGATVSEVPIHGSARLEAMWDELWAVFMATYYGEYADEFAAQMSPAVLQLIERGLSMSAVEYKRLEIERTQWWHVVSDVLSAHDALLVPTMATPPIAAEVANWPAPVDNGDGRYHSSDMCAVWNLVPTCPALSVPAGWHTDPAHTGLPIGVQFVGRPWADHTVLKLGGAIESAGLHERR